MLRAAMGPLSGETTVLMRHLVLVILCGWLSRMQGGGMLLLLVTRFEKIGGFSYNFQKYILP